MCQGREGSQPRRDLSGHWTALGCFLPGVTLGDEAKLRFIPGGIMPC